MARNEPITDAEVEQAREAILEQREEIREDLEAAGVDMSSWDERREVRADGGARASEKSEKS